MCYSWMAQRRIFITRCLSLSQSSFLSLVRTKLRLYLANHRPGNWSNLSCDLPSTAWANFEQETESQPWLRRHLSAAPTDDLWSPSIRSRGRRTGDQQRTLGNNVNLHTLYQIQLLCTILIWYLRSTGIGQTWNISHIKYIKGIYQNAGPDFS